MTAWAVRIVAAVVLGAVLGWAVTNSLPGGVVGAGLGPVALIAWLRRRAGAVARERERSLRIGLPDTLELLAAAVDGGALPETALARVADIAPRDLGDALRQGIRTADGAGLGASLRVVSPALRPLGSLLQQSEELGVPIAASLRLLASDARLRARSEGRERAAAAAPKMMLVVGGLLAPAALLVIVGGQVLVLRDLIGPVLW